MSVLPSRPFFGAVGLPWFGAGLSIAGGALPYRFSVQAGQIPPGLTLNPDGSWSGLHAAAGSYSWTVLIVDSNGASISADESETVEATLLRNITQTLPAIREGLGYSFPFEMTGGQPPYSFGGSICGMSVDRSTGVISGIASGCRSQEGVTVVDAAGFIQGYALDARNVRGTLPGAGNSWSVMSQSPFGLGLPFPTGQAPFIWSGQMPIGITLDPATGLVFGSADQAGPIPLTITVTDANGVSQTAVYTIQADANPLTIVTTSLPPAITGKTYTVKMECSASFSSVFLSPTGGNQSLFLGTYSVAPDGTITLSIPSGVPPGDYPVTVEVVGAGTLAFRTLTLTIVADHLQIGSLSGSERLSSGQAFEGQVTAFGGTPPYVFSLPEPDEALPGLALATNGVISGTPSVFGSYQFLVQVRDAAGGSNVKRIAVMIVGGGDDGLSRTIPSGTVGVPFSTQVLIPFTVSFSSLSYMVSMVWGALPPGMTLAPSGILQGLPGTSGLFSFGVQSSNPFGNGGTNTYDLVIGPNLSIQSTLLPASTVGSAYSMTLPKSGTEAVVWSLGPGTLPAGLTLDLSTGILGGTPTIAGTSVFNATATSASGAVVTTCFEVAVLPPGGLTISPAVLPPYYSPNSYSFGLEVDGGLAPYRFSVVAGILGQLTLNPDTGVVSGVPMQSGPFTIQVIDAQGQVGTVTYQPLGAGLGFYIDTRAFPPDAVVGVPYSFQLPAPHGVPPYRWLVSGSSDFAVSPAGVLSGTPQTPGKLSLSVSVQDSVNRSTQILVSLNVQAGAVAIPVQNLPFARPEAGYHSALLATGGAPPYAWSLASGSLPAGISLSTSGVLSGMAAPQPGESTFTALVQDSIGSTATQILVLQVNTTGPVILAGGATSAAGYQNATVSPGEIVSVFGLGLGPSNLAINAPDANGFGTQAAGSQVLFDGVAAPLIFVADQQVSAVAPLGIAGQALTSIVVVSNGVPSAPMVVAVSAVVPAIFTLDASGAGQAAVINQDGTVNSAANPAPRGSIIAVYATGTGALALPLTDGQLAPLSPPFAAPVAPIQAMVGNAAAQVVYQGVAPGEIVGLTQVNIAVPSNIQGGIVALSIVQNGLSSQAGVHVFIN